MKKVFKIAILSIWILLNMGVVSSAAAIRETDVSVASTGCKMVGLSGQYVADCQKALDRMNAIRLEACREHVKNPATGKALTLTDYIPLKWSADMEYIARIRAAESSITFDHIRTNGKSCFAIKSRNGYSSGCEVIAWNGSSSMLMGIEQWYAEKSAWVKGTNAVTGHYEAIINPNNRYVGLGTFLCKGVRYYNTTVGEFTSKTSGLSTSQGTSVADVIQKLEVKTSADYYTKYKSIFKTVTTTSVTSTATIKLTTSSFTMKKGRTLALKSYVSGLKTGDRISSWSSSNKTIATVSSTGLVTAKAAGSVKIKVRTVKGATATFTIKVQLKDVETTALTVKSKTILILKGKTSTLSVSRKPVTATQKISYISSNTKVATVSAGGTITARMTGKTVITIKSGTAKVLVNVWII